MDAVAARPGESGVHVARLTAADVPRYRALMLHAYEAAADAFTSTAEEREAEPESWWIKRIADPNALSAAASRQVLVVTLTVTEGNAAAIALYESCGFKTFGIEPMAIATPGGLKAKVHMWLRLPVGGVDHGCRVV